LTDNSVLGLDPSVVVLDKGLDLVSAKMMAAPGSLLSCKNYEITDTMGLSRISGYEPYDAQVSPSLTSLYRVVFDTTPTVAEGDTIVTTTVPVRDTVTTPYLLEQISGSEDYILLDGYGVDKLSYDEDLVTVVTLLNPTLTRRIVVGKVISVDLPTDSIWLMVTNSDYFSINNTLQVLDLGTVLTTDLPAISTITSAYDYYSTADDYSGAILTAAEELREDISDLSAPAAGLHLFRDTQYAVAAARTFKVSIGTFEASYTISAAAGDTIGNITNNATAYILTVSDGVVEDDGFMYYYLQVSESEDWDAAIEVGTNLTGITASGGGTSVVTLLSAQAASADNFGGILWKCVDVQTAIDQGDSPIRLGWQPVHLGASIGFTAGTWADENPPRMESPSNSSAATSTYYLTDGVNIFSCELVAVYKSTGTFLAGTAAGTFQIRNIQLVSGTVDSIDNTYDLHSANPPLVGNKVADLTDTFTHNQLELASEIAQENTRYEFITTNFYATDSFDAFYGVNGIGRAFYYNGSIFAHIYTQADADLDKPRHVENHMLHLALGFKEGSVQLSVAGEPNNFSGVDGASEFGVGDIITGLMTLSGTTLGVFCEKSIWSINGSTVDNFTQGILVPKVGCLEYSLINAGIPLYCNASGVMTLEQSEKYGDFVGIPLSFPVNTWLRPRLKRVTAASSEAPALIGVMPVRAKNQYRMFFKDGAVLTMTITPEGPKFTTQEYEYHLDDTELLVPFAWSSETDSNGEERLVVSYFDTRSGDGSPYVYEFDKGWGFAGVPIEHFFELNWFSGTSPVTYLGVHKARLQGTSRGKSSLKIAASGDLYDAEYNDAVEYVDLPRTPVKFTEAAKPVTNIASLANRGLSIQLKVTNRTLTVPEPFHTCQVLILQTKQGGKIDA
jgi:hypothetical protein